VVLDVMMPEMSGLDILPMIKKVSPKTAVIMVTVFNDQATRDLAEQLGAVAYLTKPFHIDKVLALVSDILEAKGYAVNDHVVRAG
jgi:DNA-binding response OmpR family regulator